MSDFSGFSGGLVEFHWEPLPSIMAADFESLGVAISTYNVPLKKAVGDVMVPSIKKNFQVGGRPSWRPLAMSTHEIKASRGGDNGTLIATGTLQKRAGAVDLWNIDGREGTAQIDKLPAAIAYGMVHQLGGADVPQREWALFQPQDEDDIEEVFDDWIGERIERMLTHGNTMSIGL